MEAKELIRRIEAKKVEIEKIYKRIVKWTKGLRPQDIEVLNAFDNCKYESDKWMEAVAKYRSYRDAEKNNIPSSEDWSKGPNFYEAYSAYNDLGVANNTLAKYQLQLEKLNNFEKEEKIEAIWTFLCDWEAKCHDWYLKNAERYLRLKQHYDEAFNQWKKNYLEEDPEPDTKDTRNHYTWKRYYDVCLRNWKNDYFNGINQFTIEISNLKGHYTEYDENHHQEYVYDSVVVNEEMLNKYLKEEKTRKYQDLVKRVTEKVGDILDASGLRIGKQNGEINGIVTGSKGQAKVETISAGGWNIQVYHYRVLVHKIN